MLRVYFQHGMQNVFWLFPSPAKSKIMKIWKLLDPAITFFNLEPSSQIFQMHGTDSLHWYLNPFLSGLLCRKSVVRIRIWELDRFFSNPGSQIHNFETSVTILDKKSSVILNELAPFFVYLFKSKIILNFVILVAIKKRKDNKFFPFIFCCCC